ncbi:bifunctional riboflavin kinase/FAD synthetase [Helicobacter didelphidarum]|uniref:Riboflavin biosynthesis protein n=1 Tax=Helicobacter didelphidarum TaxID=2040648 RepID=A0A3D8IQ37_9HELI|nr:riboflavin kinase [Helicobacter didelphidarum]RDU66754.1 bifunctional riboflavin kinase/FAD synthetase [Helicobacter didelphidarum]
MKSFLSFANSKLPYQSIAIGKFDGMHRAHMRLLSLVGKNGCALSITSIKSPFVTPPNERERYSEIPFYRLRFEYVRSWDSMDFLKLLVDVLPNLHTIVVGYDFCFGKDRMSSVSDMKDMLESLGKKNIQVKVLESQKYNETPIHTSIIKELIKYGDMASANAMLCRFYSIKGRIVRGQGLGKKELYPTINIKSSLYLIPKYGVYASFLQHNNRLYKGVSFVGNRMSTDNRFCIETHILEDFIDLSFYQESQTNLTYNNQQSDRTICSATSPRRDIYIRIFFVEMIRNNRKFNTLLALKEQIQCDIGKAQKILDNFPENYQEFCK